MPRKAERVGYCIYCGLTSGPLSDEHIIPYSLGGDVILPEASCLACAEITSKFELHIARRQLGAFRVRADLPTRRPKERPTTLPLKVVDEAGNRRSVELSPDEHPGTLLLPDLPEPSLLLPAIDTPRRNFGMYIALPDTSVFRLTEKHKATMIGLGAFEIGSFYLLLAKIAHAGAFQYPGDWTLFWEPLLPRLIVGECENYDWFVGGTGVDEFDVNDGGFPVFYRTVAVEDQMYLVAFFRLFGENDTPTYQVVVGRRRTRVVLSPEVIRRIDPAGLSALAVDLEAVWASLGETQEPEPGDNGGSKPG